MKNNALRRVDMPYGDRRNEVILVQYSKVLIDNLKWDHVSKTIIDFSDCLRPGPVFEAVHNDHAVPIRRDQ